VKYNLFLKDFISQFFLLGVYSLNGFSHPFPDVVLAGSPPSNEKGAG
jgi:hypothetical protein